LLKAVNAFGENFIVVSPEFNVLAASSKTSQTYGVKILKAKCHELLHNNTSPCLDCTVKASTAGTQSEIQTGRKPENQYTHSPCHYIYPIHTNEQIEAFACIELNLPVMQGLENGFQRSNTFLHKLLVSAVDAVIAADKKGRIVIFNDMAARILGYDVNAAQQEINIVDLYPNDTAYDIMKKMRSEDYGGKGHLTAYPVDVIAKNGERIPISLNAAIVYDGENEIATIGYFHDMRDELQMKEELRKAQIQLLQAEKLASIGMLATGVAHEINNPVAIMIEESGWIRDLLDEKEFQDSKNLDEFKRALKQIQTQGNRCKEITRKLLSFARKTDSKVQNTQLNEVIEAVIGLMRQKANYAGVNLKTNLDKKLPITEVSGSEMQQILLNLVNNAMDVMGDKGGNITLTSRFDLGRIVVVVEDDGPGIPDENLPKVFDPFFTTKPVGKGTGLGLFICYSLVKSMGGKIDVKSKLGKGTKFRLNLLAADSTDGAKL